MNLCTYTLCNSQVDIRSYSKSLLCLQDTLVYGCTQENLIQKVALVVAVEGRLLGVSIPTIQ